MPYPSRFRVQASHMPAYWIVRVIFRWFPSLNAVVAALRLNNSSAKLCFSNCFAIHQLCQVAIIRYLDPSHMNIAQKTTT